MSETLLNVLFGVGITACVSVLLAILNIIVQGVRYLIERKERIKREQSKRLFDLTHSNIQFLIDSLDTYSKYYTDILFTQDPLDTNDQLGLQIIASLEMNRVFEINSSGLLRAASLPDDLGDLYVAIVTSLGNEIQEALADKQSAKTEKLYAEHKSFVLKSGKFIKLSREYLASLGS